MGEGCHLLDHRPVAVALAALAFDPLSLFLVEPLGDVLELPDQFAEGHRALQRRGGHGPAQQMALRPSGQLHTWAEQPALALGVEVEAEVVVQQRLGRKGLRFQHLGLQAHEHRGGEESLTGFGQILFITAAAPHGGHQPRHFNALA